MKEENEIENSESARAVVLNRLVIHPTFDIFIIDPPWDKKKGGLRKARPNQNRDLDYDTMNTQEIFSLLDKNIFISASEPHTVFMWTIDQYLFDCEKEMLSRGYRKHCRIIWNKQNGVAPAFTVRFAHEYLLWFYKPKFMSIAKEARGKYTTILNEKAREHSRKPDIAYKMISEFYPDKSKIDVFSREGRKDYAQWGIETNKFLSEISLFDNPLPSIDIMQRTCQICLTNTYSEYCSESKDV